jgi:hypothetical protein
MSTLDRMRIDLEGIGHALSDKKLQVPVYQRVYAWQREHVTELFQDIGSAIFDGTAEYFVGSIVVSSKGTDRPEVVDGQQRLATTTILLFAIRDYFFNTGDTDRASDLERKYLKERDLRTQEEVPRFRLNKIDDDFFRKRVLATPESAERNIEPSKESHDLIAQAASLAEKHVQNIISTSNKPVDRLLDWVEYLDSHVRVIWVDVPDDANAFVIFETLNDRGLDLSITDLLKNYLFGLSGDRIEETQQYWITMMGVLEAAGGDEIAVTYIRHLWSSMHGLTRERDLYANIKKRITSKQSAVNLAIELAEDSRLYAALLNSEHSLWEAYGPSARKHISTLRLLRVEQFRPLMLALLKCFSVEEVRKTLKLLVSWSVRFLITGGVGGGTIETYYASRGKEVREGRITTAKELTKAMADVVPSDTQFEAAFAIARVSKHFLARYYLRALEMQVAGESEPELIPNTDQEVVNLEHILPQKPSSAWSHIEPELVDDYYKRVGNMVLLKRSINAKAGNDGFVDKLPYYQASLYKLSSEVSGHSEWSPDQIKERQERLAKLAVQTWPSTL